MSLQNVRKCLPVQTQYHSMFSQHILNLRLIPLNTQVTTHTKNQQSIYARRAMVGKELHLTYENQSKQTEHEICHKTEENT